MTDTLRWHIIHLIKIVIVSCLLVGCMNNENNSQPKESSPQSLTDFGKLIVSRPAPDLEHLAERSAPGRRGEDATEAFFDILKLRDIGDARGVPVLETIIAAHANSTRIHGYAAAQALFCIDRPEAHKVLSKYLLSSSYRAKLGINYTFHWEMDKSKRNSFIERYHLKNLSKDLSLKLNAETHPDKGGQRIDFTLTIRNTSDKPFRIIDRKAYLGELLYFRDESGHFARTFETVDYDMSMPTWLELAPEGYHKFSITVYVSGDDELKYYTNDVAYDISKIGRFEIYAMLEAPPLTKAQRETLEFDNPWVGRAVSKPTEIVTRK
jgi:hypothetical protein